MLHMREKSTKKWNVITISKMVLAARLRGTSHKKYHSNARSDTPHDAMIKRKTPLTLNNTTKCH